MTQEFPSFSESYNEARRKFLAAAHEAKARIHSYRQLHIEGKGGENLTCDVAVLGPEEAECAAIVISGTHGAEGFCGSAIQHRWLTSHGTDATMDSIKIVLVHAVNPWAFSHITRTTEHNVDLNRNFMVGGKYDRQNPAYDQLLPFLHADVFDAQGNIDAYSGYRRYLDLHGWHLEGEMMEGQSHRPDGLFYTGKAPEWANVTFRRIVNEHLAHAKTIGFIDWHTGIGSFGEVVFLVFNERNSEEYATAARWWGRDNLDRYAFPSGAVPKYEGLLCKAIRQELPNSQVAGAVVEIGTGDAFTIFRSDRLDRWLTFEGRHDSQYDRLREDYKNSLCPNDPSWRRSALDAGPLIMDQLFDGLRKGRLLDSRHGGISPSTDPA
jgi:hypothetical protein